MCAALVSGRDLMMRLGRDDSHVKESRELFEGSASSDFHTLMRAQQFAKNQNFEVDACRRIGIHAQTARQVDETYRHLMQVADRERLHVSQAAAVPGVSTGNTAAPDALERCLLAGFIDQLAQRTSTGTLDCTLTEGRRGTLARETVVTESPLLVYAHIKQISGRTGALTLLSHATAVKAEWLTEMFPQHLHNQIEHLFDRTHKRVAAVQVKRFLDLVIAHEHQRDVDPTATGACLADAAVRGWLELPNLDHSVRQFLARAVCIRTAMPELEFPPVDAPYLKRALTRAFHGLTLAKEAQSKSLLPAFQAEFGHARLAWVDELAPSTFVWDEARLKLTYAGRAVPNDDGDPPDEESGGPETQLKLAECFPRKTHPKVVEGRVPVRLWLQLSDGKRLDSTLDWPAWRESTYPKHRANLRSKYPGFLWP